MSESGNMELFVTRVDKKNPTQVRLTLKQDGTTLYIDKCNIASAKSRKAFVSNARKHLEWDEAELDKALITAAEECSSPANSDGVCDDFAGPTNPHRLADILLATKWHHADRPRLAFYRDEFHIWDGLRWLPKKCSAMQGEVADFLDAEFSKLADAGTLDFNDCKFSVTQRLVNDVLLALKGRVHVDESTEQPAWLDVDDTIARPEARFTFACRNGLLDLSQATPQLLPATPLFFSANGVEYDYDPAASCPEWNDFLNELWPDDPASIELLQEVFGLCCVPVTELQKILLLLGPPRSGRGTCMRILAALLGSGNVCGPTLNSLTKEFGLAPLLGKLVAVFNDARISARANDGVIVESLLSISGEDVLTVNRKFLPQIETKLNTRLIVVTNEIPAFRDSSGALASRFVVIKFAQSFLGREDIFLTERLSHELPGILNWAIAGLSRLRIRGRFVQPDSARDVIDEILQLASPVQTFVDECCVIGPSCRIARCQLFDAWKAWCDQNGYGFGNKSTFGKQLRSILPSLETEQPRPSREPRDCKPQSGRPRYYVGIALRRDCVRPFPTKRS